jgi:hypothetical protein
VEDNPNSEGIAVTPEDEIIEMAIENTINGLTFNQDGLVRFAKMIAEKEREACAKETKEIKDLLILIAGIVRDTHLHGSEMQRLLDKEKAIRARGQA